MGPPGYDYRCWFLQGHANVRRHVGCGHSDVCDTRVLNEEPSGCRDHQILHDNNENHARRVVLHDYARHVRLV